MKRYVSMNGICVFGGLLLVSQAHAQCPAGISPLQLFAGTWTFSTRGFVQPNTFTPIGGQQPFASTGRFVASMGGLLAITESSSNNGQVVRLATDAGSFQLNPDCSGGSLTFNTDTRPRKFDFAFVGGGCEISFVSSDAGSILSGRGILSAPGCGSGGIVFTGRYCCAMFDRATGTGTGCTNTTGQAALENTLRGVTCQDCAGEQFMPGGSVGSGTLSGCVLR